MVAVVSRYTFCKSGVSTLLKPTTDGADLHAKHLEVNPIWCGGGEKHPPSHTFAIPGKKLMGKVKCTYTGFSL